MLDLVTAATNTPLNPLSSPNPPPHTPQAHPTPLPLFMHTHSAPTYTVSPALWREMEEFREMAAGETKKNPKREQREARLPDLFSNPPTFPFHWSQPRQAGGQGCLRASLPACLSYLVRAACSGQGVLLHPTPPPPPPSGTVSPLPYGEKRRRRQKESGV